MNLLRTTNLKFLLVLFISITPGIIIAQQIRNQLIDSAEIAKRSINYKKALLLYKEALVISQRGRNKTLIAQDFQNIGTTYMSLDEMDHSIENYLEGLSISEKIKGNDSLEFSILIDIAYFFMDFEEIKTAEKYLDRAKILADKNGLPSYYRSYYLELGILERRKKNYPAAIESYLKSLELTPDRLAQKKMNTFISIATSYYLSDQVELSLKYLKRAESLNKVLKDEYYDMLIPGEIGTRYDHLKNYPKALEYYNLTLEKAKKSNNHRFLRYVYRELARTNNRLGNYKVAYQNYAKFVIELESSHKKEGANAIAEMSAKYEQEKSEQKIESLEKQKKLKAQIHKSQIDRRNLWIMIAILITCLTVFIAIIVFKNQRNKQRLKLELAEKQQELAKQQAELKGEEIERNRLSRELHDGLGGTLASIKMRLSSKNIEELSPILNDIDSACQDVRNMSHSLSSSFINETSFYELLMKQTEDIRHRSSLIVNLEFMPLEELNSLESERIHQCYRIIQELTNNVLKHAQAKTLTIGLIKNDDEVILLMEDDGIGFDTSSTSSGIGINNVHKRLENISGHMEITSKQNEGSTFSINFPFKSTYEN